MDSGVYFRPGVGVSVRGRLVEHRIGLVFMYPLPLKGDLAKSVTPSLTYAVFGITRKTWHD